MQLDLKELRELLTALNQTDIAELILKSNDFELVVRRGVRPELLPAEPEPSVTAASPASVSSSQLASVGSASAPSALFNAETPSQGTAEPAPASAPGSSPTPSPVEKQRLIDIASPMVGTFYRAPAPDEPPFVNKGDRIRVGQTVCIIEAMKLMNELESEVNGEIVEILVQNGEPVEYGQPLMRVDPGG